RRGQGGCCRRFQETRPGSLPRSGHPRLVSGRWPQCHSEERDPRTHQIQLPRDRAYSRGSREGVCSRQAAPPLQHPLHCQQASLGYQHLRRGRGEARHPQGYYL
ncbi:hypothetical protein KXV34_004222, partial [Aspergillus fumigatus]